MLAVNWHSFSVLWRSKDSRQGQHSHMGSGPHTHVWEVTRRKTKPLLQSVVLTLSVCSVCQHGSLPPSSPQETHKVSKSFLTGCELNWSVDCIFIFLLFSSPVLIRFVVMSILNLWVHSHSHLLQTSGSETGLRGFFLHRVYLNVFSGVSFLKN